MSKFVSAARDLPKDPGKALLIFAERALAICKTFKRPLSMEESAFIIQFLRKFTIKFDIKVPSFSDDPNNTNELNFLNWINDQFRLHLVRNIVSLEVDDVIDDFLDNQEESFGLAHLNEAEWTKINIQINNVREIIASSVLSDRKKNALYERLNRLASEVDAHGTRTDRFFPLWATSRS